MKTATAAIIEQDGRFLIAKRKMGGVVGGKWEFPGGKLEKDETPQEGLRRELKEELGVEARVGDFFDGRIRIYRTGMIRIFAYMADCLSCEFNLSEHDEIRWVPLSEIGRFDFTGNGKPIVKKLLAYAVARSGAPK